jgi:hypothetical protein
MKTPFEEGHAVASANGWCLKGAPDHEHIQEHWSGCAVLGVAIENARADGAMSLANRLVWPFDRSGAAARADAENDALAELGISAEVMKRKLAEG